MSTSVPTVSATTDDHAIRAAGLLQRYFGCLREIAEPTAAWDRATYAALLALIALWAWRVYASWGTWGSLSIDCGREMYVPAMLAEGKMLYRDVWYGYMPAAPYVNSFLFRTFSIHLNTLYWAGSFCALSCAVLLYLTGKRLGSRLIGWTAGAVVLMQSFHAWHFCFPLPYSFSAVYGCVCACLFLWFAVSACTSEHWAWMLGAGSAASLAFLVKLEFGAVCYGTLLLMVVARGILRRSWISVWKDLGGILPGVVACCAVVGWMISIGGVEFITQQNLASTWPTSYFMKTYGRTWLEHTGLAITGAALLQALGRTFFFAGALLEIYLLVWWKRFDAPAIALRLTLVLALISYVAFAVHWRALSVLGSIVFPQDMVVYVLAAGVGVVWYLHRWRDSDRGLAIAVVLIFSGLLGFRILLRMTPGGYSIYCNGPAVLSFLFLLRPLVPRLGQPRRSILRGEALICLACLAVVSIYSIQYTADRSLLAPLDTDRGSILVAKQVAENYRAGIQFMKQKASLGESVLSVPEDTSLYFLSGTYCPTRLYFFAPGILSPGKLTDEVISEIERGNVRYLLWSNRTYPDYGVPNFGTDFGQTLGDYLTSHYHSAGPLVPGSDIGWETKFTLWEKTSDAGMQQ